MRSIALSSVLLLGLVSCASKSPLEGTWTGDSGKDGFAIDLKLSGEIVEIDFASKVTTAKLKASGKYKIEEDKINTTIEKATVDAASLTGQMKELFKEAGVKEDTEKATRQLLSMQLSGPFVLEGSTLKILGNPTTIVLTKK